MNEIDLCQFCGKPLEFHDVQHNDVDGTEADLMHCVTVGCPEAWRTHSYNVRPMQPEVRAVRRAALERSIALHSAATLER